jgi:hypothetical protein
LYIDVIEHIEDDRAELARAAGHLGSGGMLVVLCPAHNCLFSEFDRMIGHHRRYNTRMLRAIMPSGLKCVEMFYLDSVGMLLSFANRYLLRSSTPTPAQITLWDRVVIPCSRLLDPLLARRFGKTVVAIWEKRG